jgi:hypothetical protein
LAGLSQAWLANLEDEMAEAARKAEAAATAAARRDARDIADRRAASIAAFKAKAGLT